MKLQQYLQEAKAAGVTEFRLAVQSDDGSTVKAIVHPLNKSGKTVDVAFNEDASVVELVSGSWEGEAAQAGEESAAAETEEHDGHTNSAPATEGEAEEGDKAAA